MKVRMKQHIIDQINNNKDDWTKIDRWYYPKSILNYFRYYEVVESVNDDDIYIVTHPHDLKDCKLLKNHFEPYNNLDDGVFDWSEE